MGALHDRPTIDRRGLVETHGYAGGRFFIENPGWLAGGALAWFVETFRLRDVGELDALGGDRAAPAPGASPSCRRMSGAMAPEWIDAARGCFYGITAAHGSGHLARAVLEGCAFAMRDVLERLQEMEVAIGSILLLGGGARSRLWAQIRADLTGLPVAVPAVVDTSPLGRCRARLGRRRAAARPARGGATGRDRGDDRSSRTPLAGAPTTMPMGPTASCSTACGRCSTDMLIAAPGRRRRREWPMTPWQGCWPASSSIRTTASRWSRRSRTVVIEDSLAGREADLVEALDLGRRLAVVSDADHASGHGAAGRAGARPRSPRSRASCCPTIPSPTSRRSTGCAAATADADALIAVGSGTINDLCKYASALDGKPYAVFATAPSMNGYTSVNAAITIEGHKKSLPAQAAAGVFFDLEVLAAAPARLIRAGLGDSLCRCTAQADWLLAHLLLGRPYRLAPYALLAEDEAATARGAPKRWWRAIWRRSAAWSARSCCRASA